MNVTVRSSVIIAGHKAFAATWRSNAMRSKVSVIPEANEFILRTSLGFPIGSRMLGPAPEEGKDYPELQDRFTERLDADRAALRWNMYLAHAAKKRPKSKGRISE